MAVFHLDACGITCLALTYAAIVYADFVVVKVLVLPVLDGSFAGCFVVVGFNILVSLMVVSHLRAVLSDPGVVPLPNVPVDLSDPDLKQAKTANGWTLCLKCESYRPPRAHHCRVCKRCIRRMDHHCPWINNCVGEWNQKYFIQFLIYVGLTSVSSLVLIIASWAIDPVSAHLKSQEAKILHSIILAIVSLLFGLFVVAILSDQIGAVFSDESPIDALQRGGGSSPTRADSPGAGRSSRREDPAPRRGKKSRMELLRNVFGRGPAFFWLLPFDLGSRSRMVQVIEGYDV